MKQLDLSDFEIDVGDDDKSYEINLTKIIMLERHYWIIGRGYTFTWNDIQIHLPAGFETDLASIPRILRSFISKDNRAIIAAAIHDLLYRQPRKRTKKMTRSMADECFKDMMEATYVNRYTQTVMWLGVRVGGWISWQK